MLKRALVATSLIGLSGLAACADYPPPGPPPGHVRWCLDHHPGYDPATNLFPTPGGLRVCRFHPRAFYGPPPPPPRPY